MRRRVTSAFILPLPGGPSINEKPQGARVRYSFIWVRCFDMQRCKMSSRRSAGGTPEMKSWYQILDNESPFRMQRWLRKSTARLVLSRGWAYSLSLTVHRTAVGLHLIQCIESLLYSFQRLGEVQVDNRYRSFLRPGFGGGTGVPGSTTGLF